MHSILFVNACVRAESRTLRLARHLLRHLPGQITEIRPAESGILPLNAERLAARDRALSEGSTDAAILAEARRFAAADEIVIATPFWDLSFPAVLKAYLEQVTVCGMTFRYSEEGIPVGLCRAKRLWYVTTVGGPYLPAFGTDYIRTLAGTFYGIPEFRCIHAEGLDLYGSDPESLLRRAEAETDALFPDAMPS